MIFTPRPTQAEYDELRDHAIALERSLHQSAKIINGNNEYYDRKIAHLVEQSVMCQDALAMQAHTMSQMQTVIETLCTRFERLSGKGHKMHLVASNDGDFPKGAA